MNFKELDIPGVFLITNFYQNDNRGTFVKPFSIDENSIKIDIKEIYYSISHKGVVRGMHFQIPPKDHSKLIYVTSGEIVDVILDPDVVALESVAIVEPVLLFEYLTSLPDADISLQLITKVLPAIPL